MPEQAIFKIAEITKLYRISASTVYREIARGRFPPAVCLTAKSRGWRKADLDKWFENLANPGGQLPLFPPDGEGRP